MEGDVDDRAASTLFHGANTEVYAQHHAAEVEVEGASPILGLTLREVRPLNSAWIVHQHVQAAKLLFSKDDHPGHVSLGSHISNNARCLLSFGSDLMNHAGTGFLV